MASALADVLSALASETGDRPTHVERWAEYWGVTERLAELRDER